MRVPVVVCCGMFKFSPLFKVGGDDEWGLRDLGSPGEVLEMGEGEGETEVLNPRWDVVPAELVDLYITNMSVLSLRVFPLIFPCRYVLEGKSVLIF